MRAAKWDCAISRHMIDRFGEIAHLYIYIFAYLLWLWQIRFWTSANLALHQIWSWHFCKFAFQFCILGMETWPFLPSIMPAYEFYCEKVSPEISILRLDSVTWLQSAKIDLLKCRSAKVQICRSVCMGWRTQSGLGRSKDPWVRTALPEEKGTRS